MRLSFPILLIISLSLVENGETKDEGTDEIAEDPIYKQLFAVVAESDSLNPSETLKLLKTLDRKYAVSNQISTHLKLVHLVSISEVSEEKCHSEYFSKLMDKTLENQQEGRTIIVDYLNHYWMKQSRVCENWFYETLEKKTKDFDENEKKTLSSLRDDIIAASKGSYKMGHLKLIKNEAIRDGIYTSMKRNLGDEFKFKSVPKENRRAKFVGEFEKQVGKVCSKIDSDQIVLQDLKDVYDMFCDQMNEEGINLFESVWLCDKIVQDRGYYHAFVYDKVRNPSNPVSLLLHRFMPSHLRHT